ncbi:MAG: citramalate synthase [Planctomycetota bacterium]|nr:citramalate synthase [Planctomycetota bacterium]
MNNEKTRIEIYDTTLRDGTQAQGVSLTLQDKLLIADALDTLGVDYIEGGYPLSNPKDEAFFVEVRKRRFKHAKVAAFGMTRRKGVKADADAGMAALLAGETPVVTIVGKSWDMHVEQVLRVSLAENLAMIAESVAFCAAAGREVIFDAEHFFDGWRTNSEYAIKTLIAAREAGASCLVLCDTNGGSLPEGIAECFDAVRAAMGEVRLGVHAHNDNALGVANSLIAVAHGATQVQGTINGIGERCGNADLTAVIANLQLKYGYDCLRPDTLKNLTEVSRFVYEAANLNFRDNQPFVGASAFAHKGGMHAHAVQRNVATYEHVDPAAIGNTRRILVSELAGASNIAATAPKKFNIADDKDAQKKVLTRIMEMENEGYQFEAAEGSFELLIRKTLGGKWYRKLWELDHYRCMILRRGGGQAGTEATVKLLVGEQVAHKVAEGDGPVDSLHKALCDALKPYFPQVDDLHLADYKVRVVNTAAETAAKVRVVIDWHDPADGEYFGTVGVSENIIDASWLALSDAVEYKLLKNTGEK